MKCPCKGCTDRTITCHGVCRLYQEWKEQAEKEAEWLRDQLPVTSEHILKQHFRKLKTAKSRKWNLKNRYGRGES